MSLVEGSVNLFESQASELQYPEMSLKVFCRSDRADSDSFYETTNGLIFGILLHILRNTDLVKEVLPKVYREVSSKAMRFAKQRDKPLIWLVLITHRQGVERLCAQDLTLSKPTRWDVEYSINGLSINISEQRRLIRSGMRMIPDRERLMLELSFFSGLGNIEIADEMGVSCEVVNENMAKVTRHVFNVVKSLRFSKLKRKSQSGYKIHS